MTGIVNEEVVDIAPALGTVIHGKYRLIRMVGEGAFAWVYGAQHETIESLRFAVKVLKPTYAQNPDILRRFKREAVTVANLQSKHTVRIFDFGVSEGGAPYIVMEFVTGISIAQMLKRDGPFTELQTGRISVGILKALEDAHSLGIVHRDLKPSNVLISKPGDERFPIAKVLDFGIAKMLSGDDKQSASADETVEGLLFCSPRYASPEILLGKPSLQSDLYSIGIIIAEMLEGEPPYGGDNNILVAAQHLGPDPVPLTAKVKSSALGSCVEKACAKSSEERYGSATEMLKDIKEIYEDLLSRFDESELDLDLTLPDDMLPPAPEQPSGQYGENGQPPYTQPMPKASLSGQMQRPGPGAYATGPVNAQGFETQPIQLGKKTNSVIVIAAVAVIIAAIVVAVKIASSGSTTPAPVTPVTSNNLATTNTPTNVEPTPVPVVAEEQGPTEREMARAFRSAIRELERAAAVPRDNRFSLRANVDTAVATMNGVPLPSLPITNFFASEMRPFTVVISASGYESLEITFDRSGGINYAANLERESSRSNRRSTPRREAASSTPEPQTPVPEPDPTPVSEPRSNPNSEVRNPFQR